MEFLLVIVLILLVVLWVKSGKNSRLERDFHYRLENLERRLSVMENKLKEQATAPRNAPEPEPVKTAPVAPAAAQAPPSVIMTEPVQAPPKMAPAASALPPPKTSAPPEEIKPSVPSAPLPPRPIPPSTPPAPPKPAFKLPKFDWESLVGVKLFSWIAGISLLLAAIFFLRYSINQGWLGPQVRMAIGIIVGIGLLVLCELKAARKYPVTANAMDASAIAILFSTFFAAHALWKLIGPLPAFALMVLVTAVAVLLSIRRDSIFIALLGLVGGFATPALLSTGENRPIGLFSYILLLNAGLAWVAARKAWPLLTVCSLVFTVVYQWGWVIKFLDSGQLPLAFGIFLVFPILFFVSLSFGKKKDPDKKWAFLSGQTANWSGLLPLLFAVYTAAVPGYGQRFGLLFGFVFLLDIGLFTVAVVRKQEILHFVGGLSTLLITAIWLGFSYTSDAWPGFLGFVLLFALFYLAAPAIARRVRREFTDLGNKAVFAAPLLLFVFPCLAHMEPACAAPGLFFGSMFLAVLAASAYTVFSGEGFVFFIAAFFTLITEAVWSAKHLTPERLYAGLAVYAVFSLLFIAVPVFARRRSKTLQPEQACAGLLLLSFALLFFLVIGPMASASIWGLAVLLLILNVGLFWEGSACRYPMFAVAGMIVSWIIFAVLWSSVSMAVILKPALAVMAGFALFVLAGNIWMQKKASGAETAISSYSIYLGLAGHIFLLAVAAQQSLCVPPWPLLGIMLLLDLAIGAAALYMRRYEIHLGAMILSALILMVWVSTAVIAPWPTVAIISAFILAFIGCVWIYLAKRASMDPAPFSQTSAITILLAQIVAVFAAFQTGSPGVGFLLVTHIIFLLTILWLATVHQSYTFAIFAVLPAAIAVSVWIAQHSGSEYWPSMLLFAVPVYLLFIAYPLVLGRRAGRSPAPYLAAVLASVPFFFQARHAIIQAGWEGAIGILPVSQALLMAALLLKLLNIELPGTRSLGRLALIAGASLAFITAAIPLQLEKNWITIGWVLEGVALIWLLGKIPHKGLLYTAAGLFAAVFVRLALNPSVLDYHPRAGMRIWNWYLYTYLISAAAMMAGGWLLARMKTALSSFMPWMIKLLPAGGTVLLFLLLNIEIADYYSTGSTITFNFDATLAQNLTYTLGWGVFAVALLAAGIMLRSKPARIASLALLTVTVIKCFLYDLYRLGGLYRVASFVGLAVCLALVALILQKFVLSVRKEGE